MVTKKFSIVVVAISTKHFFPHVLETAGENNSFHMLQFQDSYHLLGTVLGLWKKKPLKLGPALFKTNQLLSYLIFTYI